MSQVSVKHFCVSFCLTETLYSVTHYGIPGPDSKWSRFSSERAEVSSTGDVINDISGDLDVLTTKYNCLQLRCPQGPIVTTKTYTFH